MELLELLKIDLQLRTNAYNDFLTHLIEVSKERIAEEGIELTESANDNNLVVMYAAYLFNKRAEDNGMPRMLRYALNNRLFSQRMK